MDYQRLLLILKENADRDYDDFNKKIINSGVQTLGCRTPFMRKIAKQLTWEQVLDFPTHDYYEVDLLKGIVLSTAKLHFEDKSKLLTEFAQTIENWAIAVASKFLRRKKSCISNTSVNLFPTAGSLFAVTGL